MSHVNYRRPPKPKKRKERLDPTCRGKRRYSDDVAARAAAAVSLEEQANRTKLWVYKCPHCFGWHLTHKNGGRGSLVTADNPVHTRHADRAR